MNKEKIKKISLMSVIIYGIVFVVIKLTDKNRLYENEPKEKNFFEGKKIVFVENKEDKENADGVKGHLEEVGNVDYRSCYYEKYVKRGFDLILAMTGLIVLFPLFLGIGIAIKIDDPGTVFFVQKRVGQNKKYFKLYKFRSMKMNTPHDTPTHMLENPEQYITRVGKFIRKHSLDELPQLINVVAGDLSLVGPRPGLWNQDILIAEREKYGLNEMKPGITGWAQINGRDSITIGAKVKLDDYYKQHQSLLFDLRCLLGTVSKVGYDDTIIEGSRAWKRKMDNVEVKHPWMGTIPCGLKKILITGKNSYIGENIADYLNQFSEYYKVDIIETKGLVPDIRVFKDYDVVLNVAGIAHIKETPENRNLYYSVNRDLCVEIAVKAKEAGVTQFINLSSMSVYGKVTGYITKATKPMPNSAYGNSKYQADKYIKSLSDAYFKVAILRPPMVYGKGCKGNYQQLRNFSLKSPIFPNYQNERSMIYIGNLCEFIKNIIDKSKEGLFFPQNKEYISTSDMVKLIAKYNQHNILLVKGFQWLIKIIPINIIRKVFGNLAYEKVDLVDQFSFEESIKLSEM